MELANAPNYGQEREGEDEYGKDWKGMEADKVNKLKPKLFTYQRPVDQETKSKTTNLEEILAINPELSVNQVINILDSLIEEQLAHLWQKKHGDTEQFKHLSPEEYQEFKKEVSGDTKLQALQNQLSEFVEKYEQWKVAFKKRFEAMPELHPGVTWEEVEAALDKDQSAVEKLMKLDAAGFEMNVFRAKNNGEIQFRTAQTDVTQIAAKYRTIVYDPQAQKDYYHPQYKPNGNAVDLAVSMGCELADCELYEQLKVQSGGGMWLKTDDATRESGCAFFGYNYGVLSIIVLKHDAFGSLCVALRIKKA